MADSVADVPPKRLRARGARGLLVRADWLEGVGDQARLSMWVQGRVQGVGFRYWVRSRAQDLGLRGSATNLMDGRVAVVVEGPRQACFALLDAIGSEDAPGFVGDIVQSWSEPLDEPAGFWVG